MCFSSISLHHSALGIIEGIVTISSTIGVDFGGFNAIPVLGVVEIARCAGRIGGHAKARNTHVVLAVYQQPSRTRTTHVIELEVNADFLQCSE